MRLAQANSKGKTRNVEFDATRGNPVPAKPHPEELLCLSFPEGICVLFVSPKLYLEENRSNPRLSVSIRGRLNAGSRPYANCSRNRMSPE